MMAHLQHCHFIMSNGVIMTHLKCIHTLLRRMCHHYIGLIEKVCNIHRPSFVPLVGHTEILANEVELVGLMACRKIAQLICSISTGILQCGHITIIIYKILIYQ